MQHHFPIDFHGSGFTSSARFFGILPPRIRQILTSERLPRTMQMSCGLSLTTSHSAHNTAYCSDTAFRRRPAALTSIRLVHHRPLGRGSSNRAFRRRLPGSENGPCGSLCVDSIPREFLIQGGPQTDNRTALFGRRPYVAGITN